VRSGSGVATSSAISREKGFDTADKVRSGRAECSRDLENGSQGRAVLTSFEKAYVFRVVSAVKGQRFLSHATFVTQGHQHTGKGSLLKGSTVISAT
jgi:hypothetical protein